MRPYIKPIKLDIVPHKEFSNSDLTALYKKIDIELTGMEAQVAGLEVTKENIQHADTMKKQLNDISNTVEDKRQELKAPFLDHGRVIDRFAKKVNGRITSMKSEIGKKMFSTLKEKP